MYGVVNKALEEMITASYGEETWEQVKKEGAVDIEAFVSNESYPDEITYQLVSAACDILDMPSHEMLEKFGLHWVLHTGRRHYGALMESGGKNLREFLLELPNFHTRIALIFPHLIPPRFVCSEIRENSMNLHYYSHRQGLSPFVTGMIKGLGEMFQTPVSIEQTALRSSGADHDIYYVEWGNPVRP